MLIAKKYCELDMSELAALHHARTHPHTTAQLKAPPPKMSDYLSSRYAPTQNSHFYAIFGENNLFLGAVCFMINGKNKAEFGVFKNPQIPHLGAILMTKMIELAFRLDIFHLTAKAKSTNAAAIHLYKKFGFNALGAKNPAHPHKNAVWGADKTDYITFYKSLLELK